MDAKLSKSFLYCLNQLTSLFSLREKYPIIFLSMNNMACSDKNSIWFSICNQKIYLALVKTLAKHLAEHILYSSAFLENGRA